MINWNMGESHPILALRINEIRAIRDLLSYPRRDLYHTRVHAYPFTLIRPATLSRNKKTSLTLVPVDS